MTYDPRMRPPRKPISAAMVIVAVVGTFVIVAGKIGWRAVESALMRYAETTAAELAPMFEASAALYAGEPNARLVGVSRMTQGGARYGLLRWTPIEPTELGAVLAANARLCAKGGGLTAAAAAPSVVIAAVREEHSQAGPIELRQWDTLAVCVVGAPVDEARARSIVADAYAND